MISLIWEKWWPLLIAIAAAVAVYFCGEWFFLAAKNSAWHMDALYSSVFNISVAASAFLFAFYTYVRTAEGRILREIRGSKIFRRASRYMINAVIISSVLAIVTVPFLVVVPEPRPNEFWYWAVMLWVSFAVYAFAAIVRSIYHFTAIMEASFGDRLQNLG